MKEKSMRVIFFDELRGFMILNMIVYHLFYDLAVIFELPKINWIFSDLADWWQLMICGVFIFISGICCSYSKNNLKRGLRLLLWGMVFTAVTALAVPDLLIVFGLLHFMGLAVLLTIPLGKYLHKMPPFIGVAAGLLLFWITYHLQLGWIGFSPQYSIELPSFLFQNNWLFFLGFHDSHFYSSDYFPLIPYIFLFWAGVCFSGVSLPRWTTVSHSKVLAFLGRKSLWIYLLHQPILYLILYVIFKV